MAIIQINSPLLSNEDEYIAYRVMALILYILSLNKNSSFSESFISTFLFIADIAMHKITNSRTTISLDIYLRLKHSFYSNNFAIAINKLILAEGIYKLFEVRLGKRFPIIRYNAVNNCRGIFRCFSQLEIRLLNALYKELTSIGEAETKELAQSFNAWIKAGPKCKIDFSQSVFDPSLQLLLSKIWY